MADDDDKYGRKDPPEPHEWPHIFDGIQKSHKMWKVVGPFYAIVSNMKALIGIAVLLVLWNLAWSNPEFVASVRVIMGAFK